jgi:hypothetical protein
MRPGPKDRGAWANISSSKGRQSGTSAIAVNVGGNRTSSRGKEKSAFGADRFGFPSTAAAEGAAQFAHRIDDVEGITRALIDDIAYLGAQIRQAVRAARRMAAPVRQWEPAVPARDQLRQPTLFARIGKKSGS